MLWTLVTLAQGADPLVAVELVAPGGGVALSDELPLPSNRVVPSPDGKYAVSLYASSFDKDKAVVEIAAGKTNAGAVVAKVRQSLELSPWVEKKTELVYKKQTWTLSATLGETWSAIEPSASDDPQTYVLVWDDATLMPSLPDPKKKKKSPKDPQPTKERELPGGRTDPTTQASPFRLVDVGDGLTLQLESVVAPSRSHCVTGGPPAETTPTQWYVARTDLVPRLSSREIFGKLADGTGYRVAAGVPLAETAEGRYQVSTGGLTFAIETTVKEDVAFYYRASPHFDAAPSEHPIDLPPGVMGQTTLGPVSWSGDEAIPVSAMRGVRSPRATVRVACAEVRLAPAPEHLVAK